MQRFAILFLTLGVAMAPMMFASGMISTALAQDSSVEAIQDTPPTANATPIGALVGFRASERLSNPQAWQTNANGDIRFCYVITEITDEEGQSFYLSDFQLRCTRWWPLEDERTSVERIREVLQQPQQ